MTLSRAYLSTRPMLMLGFAVLPALLVGACESARFGGSYVTEQPRRPMAARPAPAETDLVPGPGPGPSGPVVSEPLPPPGGGAIPGSQPTVPPDFQAGPGEPGAPGTTPGSRPMVASRPPAAPAQPSRTAVVGSWTARDGAGSSCRVQLSSSPALDLYKASAPGCGNKDLSSVTAWDYRDGEVYLYAPGGRVVARARGDSASMSGAITRSGAPVTLSR